MEKWCHGVSDFGFFRSVSCLLFRIKKGNIFGVIITVLTGKASIHEVKSNSLLHARQHATQTESSSLSGPLCGSPSGKLDKSSFQFLLKCWQSWGTSPEIPSHPISHVLTAPGQTSTQPSGDILTASQPLLPPSRRQATGGQGLSLLWTRS